MDLAAQRGGSEPKYGFPGMFEAIIEFPKPIILAVNGLGVGFGCTICGLADLVFMADRRSSALPIYLARVNR